MGTLRGMRVVPRMGFDPMISTLKGWRPNLARRPGHNGILLQPAHLLPGRDAYAPAKTADYGGTDSGNKPAAQG